VKRNTTTTGQLILFDSTRASDGHGQGDTTELKERFIQLAINLTVGITSHPGKFISRFAYWHNDMHCASGWNELARCPGTPLIFLREIAKFKKDYRAFFCDKNPDFIRKLQARPEIASDPHAYVWCADNRNVLEIFAAAIRRYDKPRFAMGTIIIDPNGYLDPATVPVGALAEFCREFERIDLLMHLNVRSLDSDDGRRIVAATKGRRQQHDVQNLRGVSSPPGLPDRAPTGDEPDPRPLHELPDCSGKRSPPPDVSTLGDL
jgi:hypothetical protein